MPVGTEADARHGVLVTAEYLSAAGVPHPESLVETTRYDPPAVRVEGDTGDHELVPDQRLSDRRAGEGIP